MGSARHSYAIIAKEGTVHSSISWGNYGHIVLVYWKMSNWTRTPRDVRRLWHAIFLLSPCAGSFRFMALLGGLMEFQGETGFIMQSGASFIADICHNRQWRFFPPPYSLSKRTGKGLLFEERKISNIPSKISTMLPNTRFKHLKREFKGTCLLVTLFTRKGSRPYWGPTCIRVPNLGKTWIS